MKRGHLPKLIGWIALALLVGRPLPAASTAVVFRDDFVGSSLDPAQWDIHQGQTVVAGGELALVGGATALDRAQVQSAPRFTQAVWRTRIRSSDWSPQSRNSPAPDSSFGFEFFTDKNCHYAIHLVSNGHLGILEPVPDANGQCVGDPMRQVFVPISNWDNVRAGAIIEVTLWWRPSGVILDVSDGGAHTGVAAYAAPRVPGFGRPALSPVPLKMRLNADAGETYAVDFVEVQEEIADFRDDFEADAGWTKFEEPVAACYAQDVGEVVRSTDVAFGQATSLRVWANALQSTFSDHVIAGHQVSPAAKTGVLRYELRAYIDPVTGNGGQTGPEFSMQNTRQIGPGQFRTSTAGIQYRPTLPPAQRWAVWAEQGPGVAAWTPLPELSSLALQAATWYVVFIEADYVTLGYRRFGVIREGDGVGQSPPSDASAGAFVDLTRFRMAEEQKKGFDSEGFSVTAESENLFTNCTTVVDYKMYYDDAALTPVAVAVTFTDVPPSHPFFRWIESLMAAGITAGCASEPPQYCPDAEVTRAQMAVFLLRGIHGAGYGPPPPTGMFTDVPSDHPFAKWIEQLAREGITGGCSTGPPQYCPDESATRGQMAVFLLRAKHGGSYDPPPPSGIFMDVPVNHPLAKWIEQLAREGITGGCGPQTYCPDAAVTRGQMAVFLVRAFQLTL